jgi:hypothetical protein
VPRVQASGRRRDLAGRHRLHERGLVRNTGVAIGPSGNVWLVDDWTEIPLPNNPGGNSNRGAGRSRRAGEDTAARIPEVAQTAMLRAAEPSLGRSTARCAARLRGGRAPGGACRGVRPRPEPSTDPIVVAPAGVPPARLLPDHAEGGEDGA